jgi:Fe-S-cluster containining protein
MRVPNEIIARFMPCRAGCGACCIALSISSAIPGMPNGKPAGVRCAQLDDDNRCRIFGKPERPQVCSDFQAEFEFCGNTRAEALERMHALEMITRVSA